MTDEPTEPAVEEPTEVEPEERLDDDDPDQREPEEPTEVEPEESTEPDNAPSANAIVKALEREETRHRKAIAKALDLDEADLHECPTCEAMGYTPEPIEPEPDIVQDPYLEACERCKGYGEVLTGARYPGHVKQNCGGCGGSGYVTKAEYPDAQPQAPNGPALVQPAPLALPASPELAAHVAELRALGYVVVDPTAPVPVPSP